MSKFRSFGPRQPAAAGAARGRRYALGDARRGISGDAVGGQPPARQAARDRRRPAVRQADAASSPPPAPGAGRALPARCSTDARVCRERRVRPGAVPAVRVTIAANDLQPTCCCRTAAGAHPRARAHAARHPLGRAERRPAARRPKPARHLFAASAGPDADIVQTCACSRTASPRLLRCRRTQAAATAPSTWRAGVTDALRVAAHARHRPLARRRRGVVRRFAATVPGFSASACYARRQPALPRCPACCAPTLLRGFDTAPPPSLCPPMPMYVLWHLRHQSDPIHQWLRAELQNIVALALAAAEVGPPGARVACCLRRGAWSVQWAERSRLPADPRPPRPS